MCGGPPPPPPPPPLPPSPPPPLPPTAPPPETEDVDTLGTDLDPKVREAQSDKATGQRKGTDELKIDLDTEVQTGSDTSDTGGLGY